MGGAASSYDQENGHHVQTMNQNSGSQPHRVNVAPRTSRPDYGHVGNSPLNPQPPANGGSNPQRYPGIPSASSPSQPYPIVTPSQPQLEHSGHSNPASGATAPCAFLHATTPVRAWRHACHLSMRPAEVLGHGATKFHLPHCIKLKMSAYWSSSFRCSF